MQVTTMNNLNSALGILPIQSYFEDLDDIVPTELDEYILNNTYYRVLTLPKGTVGVGALHKYPHMNIVLKGSGFILSEGELIEYSQGDLIYSNPFNKKVIRVVEETKWMNVIEILDNQNADDLVFSKEEELLLYKRMLV